MGVFVVLWDQLFVVGYPEMKQHLKLNLKK